MIAFEQKFVQRFWVKVHKSDSCWLWTASLRSKGYGAFCYALNGKEIQGRAHIFSYQLHIGEIPAGMCVLHKCDTPACVNPDHLFLGTKRVNNDDMTAKGRNNQWGHKTGTSHSNAGGKHGMSKLTDDRVSEIRNLWDTGNYRVCQLAKIYGVGSSCISNIVHGISWKHLLSGDIL